MKYRTILAALLFSLSFPAQTQSQSDSLERGFLNPPDSAKPRVWWHWMNGNISKTGIKADLEWMKRTGIAGFQNFDAALNTPQVVDKRLVYMTPEWKDAFQYTVNLADQLGLEMAIAGSPGWSESGGPWVPPSQAMKKLVWSEIRIEGGRTFSGILPKPPTATGSFQNIASGRGGFGGASALPPPPEFYADTAVLAWPAARDDKPLSALQAKLTTSGGDFTLASLTDGDFAKASPLPAAPLNEKAWLQFEFPQPQTIHGLTLAVAGAGRMFGRPPSGDSGRALEASDDGSNFRVVATIPAASGLPRTLSFTPVTAKYFRVSFRTLPTPAGGPGFNFGGPPPAAGAGPQRPTAPPALQIAELVLHTAPRVNRFEEKAAFATATGLYDLPTPATGDAIPKSGVVDLTKNMRPDGTLDWTPPAGAWVVVRFGYSLTGARNSPASPEATGLEVDKLNRAYVKAYFDNYLGQYKGTVGPLMGKRGLQYVTTDSWEAGVQNWTDEMIAEFTKRRGYDMRPWLPVLTGRVVESAESSDRFLWDFRKTIGDLTTEYHYDQLSIALHQRDMGRYTESHESNRAFIGDGMEVKRGAEIPMSALWVGREQIGAEADIRESASVAHIYGQNLVAAESLTVGGSGWAWAPETLKPSADLELASGLNRFVIHTSVHQPSHDKIPGLSLGPFGQFFTRHETWAEIAKPWMTYLARSSYLLQQGKFVADILYFYGEDSNVTALFGAKQPDIPAGYNFDYINADAIVHRLAVTAGRLTTPSGMSYRVLALDPNARYMSLPVLRKIRDLVNAGATVVGPKPLATPSLGDSLQEFNAIANQLWSSGKIPANQTLAQTLSTLKVLPDFEYAKPQSDTRLLYVHRTLPGAELYWVNNRNNRPESLEAQFRIQGKAAEFWYPETGKMEPASYRAANGRTVVPLRLQPAEAVFVVFRHAATAPWRTLPVPTESVVTAIPGPWEVAFQPDRGAPPKQSFDSLVAWNTHSDPGVKYFSGTAAYSKSIQAPADWFKSGARLWLDLGDVKNLAEVSINGKSQGVLWKTPFRLDVTAALKPGPNTIEVKVTNLWVNRLIGDLQPNAKKITFTTQQFYRPDSPLFPSGLLGPVQLVRTQ
jgi:hypothetical protein